MMGGEEWERGVWLSFIQLEAYISTLSHLFFFWELKVQCYELSVSITFPTLFTFPAYFLYRCPIVTIMLCHKQKSQFHMTKRVYFASYVRGSGGLIKAHLILAGLAHASRNWLEVS